MEYFLVQFLILESQAKLSEVDAILDDSLVDDFLLLEAPFVRLAEHDAL